MHAARNERPASCAFRIEAFPFGKASAAIVIVRWPVGLGEAHSYNHKARDHGRSDGDGDAHDRSRIAGGYAHDSVVVIILCRHVVGFDQLADELSQCLMLRTLIGCGKEAAKVDLRRVAARCAFGLVGHHDIAALIPA